MILNTKINRETTNTLLITVILIGGVNTCQGIVYIKKKSELLSG